LNEPSPFATGNGGGDPHVDEDLCIDLIHDLLPVAEKERVLRHLSVCAACEELVRGRVVEHEHRRAAKAVRFSPDGEILVEERTEASDDGAEDVAGFRLGDLLVRAGSRLLEWVQSARLRPAWAVAIPAALLILLLWPHETGPPETVLLRWLPSSSEILPLRAADSSGATEDLAAGLAAYAARDLETAVQRLEATEATGTLETVRRAYLGSALAWTGRYAEAAEILQTVSPRALPDPWAAEARWTLFVALRGSGQIAAADSLLQALAEEGGDRVARARRLLER